METHDVSKHPPAAVDSGSPRRRHKRLPQALAALAAAGGLVAGVAACGTSGNLAFDPTPTGSGGQAATRSSSDESDSSSPVASWKYAWSVSGGYSYTGALSLFAPEPATNEYVAACNVNPQTDAEVEFQSRIVNTTASFAGAPAMNFAVTSSSQQAPVLIVNEGKCRQYSSGGDGWYLGSQSLQPQATVQSNGFIVVPGYYSPDHPQGDPDLLATFNVNPQLVTGDGFTATGPGFSQNNGDAFDLSVLAGGQPDQTYTAP